MFSSCGGRWFVWNSTPPLPLVSKDVEGWGHLFKKIHFIIIKSIFSQNVRGVLLGVKGSLEGWLDRT